MRLAFSGMAIFGVALLASQQPVAAGTHPATEASDGIRCQTKVVTLDTAFPAGNIKECKTFGKKRLDIRIAPEDPGEINCSAWYAFRLNPKRKTRVTINLNYESCGHRYWPKTSPDGLNWNYLPAKFVKITEEDGVKQAQITIKLDKHPLFVSAQEIIVPATYQAWIDEQAKSPDAIASLLGKSAESRDIPVLSIKKSGSKPKEQVVLIGRQHPPEVTGALAMLPFVETLLGDDPLALRYRTRFETIVVPMLNPDGVVRGYWRHNTGSTDLNRDWGPFKQPETQLMDGLLKKIAANPDQQLRFFVDFHSTQNDIFYTIPDDYPTKPALFLKNWLQLLQDKAPDYQVNRNAGHNLGQPNSKNYVHKAYGVPTVTYEMGDETDRELIRKVARSAAIAMMETLLAVEPGE